MTKTQIDYDYYAGRAIYAPASMAAEFELLRSRAKLAAGNHVEARAVITALSDIWKYEVFYHQGDNNPNEGERWELGWYWVSHNGEPNGPFATSVAAHMDAQCS